MPKNKPWQETIDITPFVERIEDAIMALGHESAQDFETLAYRIGVELSRRYADAELQVLQVGCSTSTRG